MHRRSLLVAVGSAGVTLTGCLGQGSAPESETDTPTEGDVGRCPPAPDSQDVDVPPWPDHPDSLSRDAATRFAARFEEAYAARQALAETRADVTAVTVRAYESNAEASRADGGWEVHFAVREPTFTHRTPTEGPHHDPGRYYASYFVSDHEVLRARDTEAVDPRAEGVALDCHRAGGRNASATPSATGTPAGPYEFATVHSNHDATHRIRLLITDIASGATEYEVERPLEPGFEDRIEITDEWLTEAGRYRVRAETDDGLATAVEVEADRTWACDHSVAVEITDEGRLVSAVAVGSGKGC